MTRRLSLAASSVAAFARRHIDLLRVASALC
ncbi:MAG: putative leader peptide [Dermatophilaceae bacterium]